MLLRQVQARPLQGHHLRALRRRGDAAEGAPRAHGSHRPRRARSRTSGSSRASRAASATCSTSPRASSRRSSTSPPRSSTSGRREAAAEATSPTSRTRSRAESRADLRRPRRGARRARRPARSAGATTSPSGKEQQLRRGRRLLGPRARQLGRGVSCCRPSRRSAQLGSGVFVAAREVDHDRGLASKIRELVRQTATREDRRLAPRELESVAASAGPDPRARSLRCAAELAKATGSKKGAITKHI